MYYFRSVTQLHRKWKFLFSCRAYSSTTAKKNMHTYQPLLATCKNDCKVYIIKHTHTHTTVQTPNTFSFLHCEASFLNYYLMCTHAYTHTVLFSLTDQWRISTYSNRVNVEWNQSLAKDSHYQEILKFSTTTNYTLSSSSSSWCSQATCSGQPGWLM